MKTSVFSHWLHHHLEKQPHYIKKLLKHSAVLRTNQEAIARSMAIALFMSCIPIPFHSVLVILMAIFLAANPLIAFTVLWIVNNPFTMAPIYYGCYRIGLWILQLPPQPFEFENAENHLTCKKYILLCFYKSHHFLLLCRKRRFIKFGCWLQN